jgi:hypothetical protein
MSTQRELASEVHKVSSELNIGGHLVSTGITAARAVRRRATDQGLLVETAWPPCELVVDVVDEHAILGDPLGVRRVKPQGLFGELDATPSELGLKVVPLYSLPVPSEASYIKSLNEACDNLAGRLTPISGTSKG